MYSDLQRKSINDLIGEFAKYKKKAEFIATAAEKSIAWRSSALEVKNCNNQFGYWDDGTYYGNFCRKRICPMCQRRKSIKTYSELRQVSDKLGGAYILATFTLRNVSSSRINYAIDKLYFAFSNLWRKKLQKHFNGCFRALEVTYNAERDDMHPHLHCIIQVDKSYFTSRKYLSQSEILRLWRDELGGNDGGCDLRKIKDVEKGVAEVAKYAVKPFDIKDEKLTAKLLDELFAPLKNRRLTQSYGNIAAALKEIKADYEPNEREAKSCDKWFIWNEKEGKYESGLS